jgi:quercetin 2,3-dioxygenase
MPKNQPVVARPGETRAPGPLDILGDLVSLKLSSADTGGGFAVMEETTPPQGGPPLHRHSREDEWFYILEGDYLFEVDDDNFTVGAGASVYAPKGTAHTFQNIGPTDGRILIVAQPAGIDAFFTELAAASEGLAEPDMARIAPVFEKYGIEFLGPPIGVRQSMATAEG